MNLFALCIYFIMALLREHGRYGDVPCSHNDAPSASFGNLKCWEIFL